MITDGPANLPAGVDRANRQVQPVVGTGNPPLKHATTYEVLGDSRDGCVVVADNDEVIRGVLRAIMIGVGRDVLVAGNGEEAIVFALREQVRLFVLDLDMPKLNGLLTCRRLRALPSYESTPIAILTHHDEESARSAAMRVGATLFLAKPFQPAALLASLSPFLGIDTGTHRAMARTVRHAPEIADIEPNKQVSMRNLPLSG
jgi:DNA-binding response OmpR family regulator